MFLELIHCLSKNTGCGYENTEWEMSEYHPVVPSSVFFLAPPLLIHVRRPNITS